MAKATLKLVESSKEIEKRINKALVTELNKALDKTARRIVVPVKSIVRQALLNQPEVSSLSGGRLAAEFGLPDGRNRIDNIISQWVDGIIVTTTKATATRNKLSGGLTIKMIPRNFVDVLGLTTSKVTTDKGQDLPWLEWLLLFGDKAIVRDFSISFDSNRVGRSRSGFAVMQSNPGAFWRVPPEFAGTEDNNFVTRALSTIETDINQVIETQFKSAT